MTIQRGIVDSNNIHSAVHSVAYLRQFADLCLERSSFWKVMPSASYKEFWNSPTSVAAFSLSQHNICRSVSIFPPIGYAAT